MQDVHCLEDLFVGAWIYNTNTNNYFFIVHIEEYNGGSKITVLNSNKERKFSPWTNKREFGHVKVLNEEEVTMLELGAKFNE